MMHAAAGTRWGGFAPTIAPDLGGVRYRKGRPCVFCHASDHGLEREDIVIVGGGISGLATAAALHKIGLKSVVLEQGETLRATGTTVTLWGNAWRALDVLGVGDGIRSKYSALDGMQYRSLDGKVLSQVRFQDAANGPHEVRNVGRSDILNALATSLPSQTVRLNSKVVSIRQDSAGAGYTEVKLEDGTALTSKVLIGCDGLRSVVGRWLKLPEPKFAGYIVIRGIAVYPDGHSRDYVLQTVVGKGIRVAFIPSSPHQVYWAACVNGSSKGPKITDPNTIKQAAAALVQDFPDFIREAVDKTPLENLARSLIRDRWSFPFSPQVKNGVTVAGDASHPMTPNLGQGGCCALEDAIVLAQELHTAFAPDLGAGKPESITERLETFSKRRWERTFPLVVKSNLLGVLLQSPHSLVCHWRDKYLLPGLKPDDLLVSSLFDCGQLPPAAAVAGAGPLSG